MKSLVIEDEVSSRMMLAHFLKEYGTCDTAENLHEAMEAFDEALSSDAPYDLICIDIKLPGPDGIEILKEIRRKEKEKGIDEGVKISMTTSLTDTETVLRAAREHCDGYLLKPITKELVAGFLEAAGLA